MMFKRISFIASLLFFLLGTTVFAYSNHETSTPNSVKHISVKKVVNDVSGKALTASKPVNTQMTAMKKAEPTLKDYVVPAAVGLFIIFILGGYWFFFRKKYITR